MNKFMVTNTGVQEVTLLADSPFNSNHVVYEVLRIMDGIPLFVEDHFERLMSSARISLLKLNMEMPEFVQHIDELIIANQQKIGNVKFMLSLSENQTKWSFSFIPHSYPSEKVYHQGVPTGLLYAERNNPSAKIVQPNVREKADHLIATRNLFEVLLVDRNGHITEGSRSNVFFVKDDCFYTAPASMVLSGVTRKKVLECLSELNFPVIEKAVRADEAMKYDAVFLTGTSPKVLPVNAIEDNSFEVGHLLVNQLMDHYNNKIEEYINQKKRLSDFN